MIGEAFRERASAKPKVHLKGMQAAA